MLKNIPKLKEIPIEGSLIFICIILLPLKPIWSNVPLIAFVLMALLKYHQNLKKNLRSIGLLLFISFFLLYVVGIAFTSEYKSEIKVIEKVISFFIVPLTFALLPKEKISEVTTGFWEGIFSLAFFLGLLSFFSAAQIYTEIGYIPVDGPRVNEISHIHRPYFGLIEVLSVVYVLSLIYHHGFKINSIRYVGLLISIAALLLIVARLTIATLGIALMYFTFMYLYKRNLLNFKTLIVIALVFASSLILLLNYPRFTDRFEYLMQGKGEARILIWRCAYDQFTDEDFSLLVGHFNSTSTSNKLIECYKNEFEQNTYWSWVHESKSNFNAHNEYLNLILSYGIIGLSIFIMIITFLYKESIKYNYFAAQLFVIVFAINCFTENMLARQVSIFIFTICAATIIFNKKNFNH